jgi:hypothetical protein
MLNGTREDRPQASPLAPAWNRQVTARLTETPKSVQARFVLPPGRVNECNRLIATSETVLTSGWMKVYCTVVVLVLSTSMFGQQIHGVLIGQDGQPAKRITVAALWMCPAGGKPCRISKSSAVTDQNGEFRFNRVGVGKYAVFAEDKEAGYGYGASSIADDPRYTGVAEITPEHPDAELRLFLPPQAGFLDVRLTDQSTGTEISTVTVSVAANPNANRFQTTFERSNCQQFGHNLCYVLIPPDTQVTVRVSSPGYEGWDGKNDTTERALRLASGDRVTWEAQLKPDLKWRALMNLTPPQLKTSTPSPSK